MTELEATTIPQETDTEMPTVYFGYGMPPARPDLIGNGQGLLGALGEVTKLETSDEVAETHTHITPEQIG